MEVALLKEEIKRLEPLESRSKVLNEEVTKLIANLWVSEQRTVAAE